MEYEPLDVHVAHTTCQSHTSHGLLPEAELYRIADASSGPCLRYFAS